MTITVLVPTFRRPQDLARCLSAMDAQTRPAEQIVVVRRAGDTDTEEVLRRFPNVETVCVTEPGVVAAMNAGLAAARGEIVALTDDDAAPRSDWLARLEAHFAADETVGGVGGRDWLHYEDGTDEHGTHPTVGKVQKHGRVVGNHHLGAGGPRAVDFLKGVNGAYRAAALRPAGFDTRLRGAGAQVHWELVLGLALRRAGWKLVYDPAVAVDHFPAARRDTDTNNRGIFHGPTLVDSVHNETLALLEHLPPVRRAVFLAWAALVGAAVAPGLLQAARLWLKRDPHVFARLRATCAGRAAGVQTFLKTFRRARAERHHK